MQIPWYIGWTLIAAFGFGKSAEKGWLWGYLRVSRVTHLHYAMNHFSKALSDISNHYAGGPNLRLQSLVTDPQV